ncbi:hypothetical protein HUW46_00060 [Amycolatopsis sp. CA-230715]|nr:hypothetical protein HUW46_00060 [Amycolatopsis sp. CA-230715]
MVTRRGARRGGRPDHHAPKDAPTEGRVVYVAGGSSWGGLCQDLGSRGGLPPPARVPEGCSYRCHGVAFSDSGAANFALVGGFCCLGGDLPGAPKVAFRASSAPKVTFGACASRWLGVRGVDLCRLAPRGWLSGRAQPCPDACEGRESGASVPEGGLRGPSGAPPPISRHPATRTRHHCDLRGGRRREFDPRTALPPPAPIRGGLSGAPMVAFGESSALKVTFGAGVSWWSSVRGVDVRR